MTAALLFEIAWKTGLVAAVVLLGAALLRARPAAERVALLRLGVVMVFALPLMSALVPALRVEPPAAIARFEPAAPALVRAAAPVATGDPLDAARPAATAAAAPAPVRLDPLIVVAFVYGAGVLLVLLRLMTGVRALARWTRSARPVSDALWLAALDRAAGPGRRPRLLASPLVASPLSWGVLPGVILIGEDAIACADRADAVLTHEMGHVRHGDWAFLMLSRVLVALFWFNPLVWLLQRELARQSERAADAWAVRRVPRTDYASTLVAMARRGRPHAALGMAAPSSELARRVAAVLSGPASAGRPWPTALTAAACIGLATPLAALELAPEVLPTALRPTPAPATLTGLAPTDVAEATALVTAVAASVPDAFAAPRPSRDGEPLPADQVATVTRQRDQGLALMAAGAAAMEASARQMRQQADHLPMTRPERDQLKREADELDAQARQLRKEASELAARAPATLAPLPPEAERELSDGLAWMKAMPTPSNVAVDVKLDLSADVRGDTRVGRLPQPEPLSVRTARIRAEAGRMRGDAGMMEAEAARLEHATPRPPSDTRIADLRTEARRLHGQADDLERQADALGPP